jgi:hypothetical protein
MGPSFSEWGRWMVCAWKEFRYAAGYDWRNRWRRLCGIYEMSPLEQAKERLGIRKE